MTSSSVVMPIDPGATFVDAHADKSAVVADVAASREAGFVEHLTMPVDLAALEAAIGRVKAAGG